MLRNLKIVVAGEKSVGKTSLVEQYTAGKFSGLHSHSLGLNVVNHITMVGKTPVKMEIWDIAGEYASRNEFYRGAEACLLVYDVTSEKSLQQLTEWVNKCKLAVPNAALVVVGNKVDLNYRFPIKWAQIFAHYANAPHLTASANTGENVELVFNELVQSSLQIPLVSNSNTLAS